MTLPNPGSAPPSPLSSSPLSSSMSSSPLVDAPWLARRLRESGVVVLDASAAMPGDDHDPAGAFRAAHIPGARFFDLDLFADPDTALPHMVPSAGRFARLAGALGIGDTTTVVVYEAGRMFSAARAWWLFRLFGHDDVHVLDGGLAAWRDAGGEIVGSVDDDGSDPAATGTATFTPRLRTTLLAGLGDVERLDGATLLLDARAAGRFEGTVPEPRPGIRSGHIPGSRNLPFTRLLDAGGRMRPADAVRDAFAAAGVDGARPVIASCGTGVTAAVLCLGASLAGLPDIRLYDGSWTEYASVHRRGE